MIDLLKDITSNFLNKFLVNKIEQVLIVFPPVLFLLKVFLNSDYQLIINAITNINVAYHLHLVDAFRVAMAMLAAVGELGILLMFVSSLSKDKDVYARNFGKLITKSIIWFDIILVWDLAVFGIPNMMFLMNSFILEFWTFIGVFLGLPILVTETTDFFRTINQNLKGHKLPLQICFNFV